MTPDMFFLFEKRRGGKRYWILVGWTTPLRTQDAGKSPGKFEGVGCWGSPDLKKRLILLMTGILGQGGQPNLYYKT